MRHNRAVYELAVAQVIEGLHNQKGVSRQALADALEISELEVTRLEAGSEALSAGGLMVLLKLYGLSLEEFEKKVHGQLASAQSRIDRVSHRK